MTEPRRRTSPTPPGGGSSTTRPRQPDPQRATGGTWPCRSPREGGTSSPGGTASVRATSSPSRANAAAGRQRFTEDGEHNPRGTSSTLNSTRPPLTPAGSSTSGRIRRATEGARANSSATRRAAGPSSSPRRLRRRLLRQPPRPRPPAGIARETAKSRGESLEIFRLRFEGGSLRGRVRQVKSQYERRWRHPGGWRSPSPLQRTGFPSAGPQPGPIPRGKTIDQLTLPASPPVSPRILLARRPDILRAETEPGRRQREDRRRGRARTSDHRPDRLLRNPPSTDLIQALHGPAQVWTTAPRSPCRSSPRKLAGDVQAAERSAASAGGYRQAIQGAFARSTTASPTRPDAESSCRPASRWGACGSTWSWPSLRFANGYASYLRGARRGTVAVNVQLELQQNQGSCSRP